MEWEIFSHRLTGVAHRRKGMPCQDALCVVRHPRGVIAAVADGHGSAACPFSDEGAQAAVDVAAALFGRLLEEGMGREDLRFLREQMDEKVPKMLENLWKEAVLAQHVASGRESLPLPTLHLQYGCTLLVLVLTDAFLLALQIGDGDMLTVQAQGETQWILEQDRLGTETESLCQEHAWKWMKYRLIPLGESVTAPALLTLSTDGYRDSFTDKAGFAQTGSDFLSLLREEGVEQVQAHLPQWLEEASAISGDDISFIGIYAC